MEYKQWEEKYYVAILDENENTILETDFDCENDDVYYFLKMFEKLEKNPRFMESGRVELRCCHYADGEYKYTSIDEVVSD